MRVASLIGFCLVALIQPLAAEGTAIERYLVSVSVYEADLTESLPSDAGAILDMIESTKMRPTETISISAVSGGEAMAQFGRTSQVVVGRSQERGGGGERKVMKDYPTGTLLTITVEPVDSRILVDVKFERSRLGETAAEDLGPNILTERTATTLLLEPGKPALLSAGQSEQRVYTVVTAKTLPLAE